MQKNSSHLLLLILLLSLVTAVIPWTTPTPVTGTTYPTFTEVDDFPTGASIWYMDIDEQGLIYAAEGALSRVAIYHPNGTLQGTIPGFTQPIGVAVVGNRVYVTDYGTDNLTIFEDGLIIHSLPAPSANNVEVAPDGRIFLIDSDSNQVTVYNPDYSLNTTLLGHFLPRSLALGPDGRLFVSNSGSHNVTVYAPDLSLLGTLSAWGPGPGEVAAPYHVEVDVDGYIYLADFTLERIQVFNPDLQLVGTISEVPYVIGFTLDGNGRIYVGDWLFGGMKVFETTDLGDQDGPLITDITVSPANPLAGQPVTLTASITDLSGIQNATVTYTTPGGSATVLLLPANGSYSATLPGFPGGSPVTLTLWAEDQSLARHTTTHVYVFNVNSGPLVPGIDNGYLAVGGLGLGGLALILVIIRRPKTPSKKSRR